MMGSASLAEIGAWETFCSRIIVIAWAITKSGIRIESSVRSTLGTEHKYVDYLASCASVEAAVTGVCGKEDCKVAK